MYVCVCVCICLLLLANHVSFIFQKKNVACDGTDGRQLLLLPLAVPLPLPPSAPSPRPRHSSSFIPIPTPDPRSPVNNKSSCACQSLFEKQPFGYEIGRGSKQISSSSSGNSSHRSQRPPQRQRRLYRYQPNGAHEGGGKAKWKKKLIFLLIFVPVNSKCLHSFIKRPLQWPLSLSLPSNSTPTSNSTPICFAKPG